MCIASEGPITTQQTLSIHVVQSTDIDKSCERLSKVRIPVESDTICLE
jgi:hypothetical protein